LKQRTSLALGVAVSLFFLWLGFRGLNLNELLDTLGSVNLLWIAVAVPVYFVATYILTWRWYYLLRPVKDIHPNRLFPVVVIGYMANNLLPLRLGEVMRAYVLKRRDETPIAPTLTTIFVERVFDGLVMLTLIFIALFFVDFEEPTLRTIIFLTSPLFFGALLLFFWLASAPDIARRLYSWLIKTFVPSPLQERALSVVEQLMSGLESLRSGRAMLQVIFFSLWSWLVESSTYWIVMQAFDFKVSFSVLLLVVGFGNLSTILPSTSGYIGTFHAVAILTLVAFDVDRVAAGSYAIVMHATLWLPITLAGLIFLIRLGFHWSDFRTAQEVVHNTEEAIDSTTPTQLLNDESEALV